MKSIMGTISFVALAVTLALPAMAADMPSEAAFFQNVNVFDGRSETLREGDEVLAIPT